MHTSIPVITCLDNTPIYLTDRWGSWILGRGPIENTNSLSDRLANKFSEEDPKTLGDPRWFMGSNEISHIAYMTGRVGILTEVELKYVESSDVEIVMEDEDSGTTLVPPSDFAVMIIENQKELSGLQEAFPESTLFVMHGESTYDGRLTICAFTPLSGQNEMIYDSPYFVAHEIQALDNFLNQTFA